MEKYNQDNKSLINKYKNEFPYSSEEIRRYISEIRLIISENPVPPTDAKALEVIEEYVFSLKKAQSCSHRHNDKLIEQFSFH